MCVYMLHLSINCIYSVLFARISIKTGCMNKCDHVTIKIHSTHIKLSDVYSLSLYSHQPHEA